jgi:thioredoxin reductase (NADPH)
VDAHHLAICPNGELLHYPRENELARRISLVRPIDTTKVYDVAIVGAEPCRGRSMERTLLTS